MKKLHLRPVALLCLLLALVLVTGVTFGWLSKEQSANTMYAVLSDFDVSGTLSFGTTEFEGESVLVPVSFVKSDPHYLGNLKYTVRYQGASPAAIRVRVLEQWTDVATGDLLSANYLNYHIAGTAGERVRPDSSSLPAAGQDGVGDPTLALASEGVWVDRRATDFCYYYSIPVQPHKIYVTQDGVSGDVTAISEGSVELTFLDQTKGDTDAMLAGLDPATTQLDLLIEVEAVQPNRILEFFGMESLPQPAAQSAAP